MSTDTNTAPAKETREQGPLAIHFIDGEHKEHTRIPASVASLKITERATGHNVSLNMNELGSDVLHLLASMGAKKIIETYCRNSNDEHGTNVINSANTIIAKLKAGQVYARTPKDENSKSDGKRGPKFDFGFWTDVVKVYTKRNTGKDATEAQVEAFNTKLVSLTPEGRKAQTAAWMKNPAFKAARLSVETARAMQKAKDDTTTDTSLDLF